MDTTASFDARPRATEGPLLDSAFVGLAREHGFEPLKVEGTLPLDLAGTFYRNGPSVFDAGRSHHWFDGTGAVAAVRFDGGAARGAVRLVRTPSVAHDQGRRATTYGAFGQTASVAQRVRGLFGGQLLRNVANINVLAWQRRLFAMYETLKPVEIDPETLESLGETDLDGVVLGAWNAHPRRVEARRTTYQFGVRIGSKVFLDIYALPDEGAARRLTSIRLPGVVEVHDVVATERHLVFVVPPWIAHPLALVASGRYADAMRWRPSMGTRIFVVPIDAPDDVIEIETEPFFTWHVANAYEAGGRIVLDLVHYPDFAIQDRWVRGMTAGDDPFKTAARLERGVLDLERRSATWETRWAHPCEFPSVSPQRGCREHRHVWAAAFDPASEGHGWWSRAARVDVVRGDATYIDPGPRCAIGEPVLVPRSDREDDAWVLAFVRDHARALSWVGVWDAAAPEKRWVARALFDQLLPPGLHGAWVGSR